VGVAAAILGDQLVVTIEDDGKGFSPGSMGHGIEGMLDRARMVAGRVDLERPAGGGARVRFEMQIGPS
jgi:signal transduction histidine kinase